jgi:BirA family biotin operon repressor/biotin-[acetyl-CoA-carboxylase] ligase
MCDEGNLFISLIWRESDSRWTSWLPLATAVGMSKVFVPYAGTKSLTIKWPNDLLLDGAKLGGILCERTAQVDQPAAIIVGIGINTMSAPTGIDQAVAALGVPADLVREKIAGAVTAEFESLMRSGTSRLVQDYERVCEFPQGSLIKWGVDRSGIVKGLGSSGELLVRTQDGTELALFAEEVTRVRSL